MADLNIYTTDLSVSIAKETEEGKALTTGSRQELPVKNTQAPLTFAVGKVTDDTRRAKRDTAAPTDGMGSVSGTLTASLRECDAIELLMESALSGEFDENGVLASSDTDVFFTVFQTLKDEATKFLGYVDSGCQATKMTISGQATSDSSVSVAFDVMGLSRERKEQKSTLAVDGANKPAFDYIDVGNLKIDKQPIEFTDLDFSTGVARAGRRVFGSKNAKGLAPSANRETALTLKVFRTGFDIDDLVEGDPVEVSFEVKKEGGSGYLVTLTHAKATRPTDELSDTGLLANIEFTGHRKDNATPSVIVKRI